MYLLLRKNHQTGPYTIDELLQQQLRGTDLIWVQGSSQVWSFPGEVPELKEFLNDGLKAENAPMLPRPGSSSTDELEQRAEELRQSVLAFPQKFIMRKLSAEDELSVDALRAMAQQRIEFVDHRKKESPAFEWMSGVMVVLIVAAGVYGGGKFFNARTNHLSHPPALVTKAVSLDSHAAKVIAVPVPAPVVAMHEESAKDTAKSPVVQKQKPVISFKPKKRLTTTALPTTAIGRVRVPAHTKDDTSSSIETPPEELKTGIIEPAPRAIVTEEPAEKKKAGLFKGLFRKKKKNEEKLIEQDIKTGQNQEN